MGKRLVLFVSALALLAAAAAWSQTTTSLESSISYGIFSNPYDFAFNPSDSVSGPGFTGLQKSYLFGGLTNFFSQKATSGLVTAPLTFGYYSAGSMPWSGLLQFQDNPAQPTTAVSDNTATTISNSTTLTTGTPPVTNTYNWVQQSTQTTYDFKQAENLYAFGQALVGHLGPVNTGLWVYFSQKQNAFSTYGTTDTWLGANVTTVQTNNYDTNPGGVPAPKLNYTYTNTKKDPQTQTNFDASVPFYLPLGKMALGGSLTGSYQSNDKSSSTSQTYTAPQATGAGNFQTNDTSVTDQTGYFGVNGVATLTLPALIGKNKYDRFDVGFNGGVTFNNAGNYVKVTNNQQYSYAGGGAALAPSNTTGTATSYNSTTDTRVGQTGYNVDLSAQHYFYFDIAQPIVLGIAPQLSGGISFTPTSTQPYYVSQQVLVSKVDNNNNGVYTDAADQITTTTTTYSNNTQNGAFAVAITMTLPTALKIAPKGWPFGITLGNEMIAGATITTTTANTASYSTQTVVTDGTGATLNTTDSNTIAGTTNKTTKTNWTFTTQNSLGLNFYLPGDSTLDVTLNTNNFFTFDNLTIQAVVPLP